MTNSRASKSKFILMYAHNGTGNSDTFYPLFHNGNSNASTTEASTNTPYTPAFTVKRTRVIVITNSKNVASPLSFRDDGADVGLLSITASTTGEFDSGEITVNIASGSQINFEGDTSPSSSGTLTSTMFAECH